MDYAEEKIQNLILEKIKKEITFEVLKDGIEEYNSKTKYTKITKKEFLRIKKHCIERIKNGFSYRDAWGIDSWMIIVMPGILKELRDNLHGYPGIAENLHAECEKIDPGIKCDQNENESMDDYRFRVYQNDLDRMIFLFTESNEFKSSRKNPYKLISKHHHQEIEMNGQKMYELVDDCNEEEKANNKKWFDEEIKIENYRSECLHTAMKLLEIYIQALWD